MGVAREYDTEGVQQADPRQAADIGRDSRIGQRREILRHLGRGVHVTPRAPRAGQFKVGRSAIPRMFRQAHHERNNLDTSSLSLSKDSSTLTLQRHRRSRPLEILSLFVPQRQADVYDQLVQGEAIR
jgi:hypothetical protein